MAHVVNGKALEPQACPEFKFRKGIVGEVPCCVRGMITKKVGFIALLGCLVFSFAQATEVRLSGMGDLRLVVQDETNPITLFRFGGNPAGVVGDETTSTYKLDFSYGGRTSSTAGRTDSVDYKVFGDVLPLTLRAFLPSVSSIANATGFDEVEDVPELGLPPVGGTFVWRQKKEDSYVWGQESKKAQAFWADLGYSRINREDHRIKDRVGTPRAELIYGMDLNNKFGYGMSGTFWSAGYACDSTKESASLTTWGAGLGGRYTPVTQVSFGPLFNVYYPGVSAKSGTTSWNYSGPGYSGGLATVFAPSWATFGGKVLLSSVKLKGHGETGRMSGYEGALQALTRLPRLPLNFGVEAGYFSKHPIGEDSSGRRKYDNEFKRWRAGGGVGLRVSRFFLGAEAGMREQTQTDHLGGYGPAYRDTTFIESEQTAKFGAEVDLPAHVFVRTGYVWSSFDPDTKVSLNGETRNKITLGIGTKLLGGKYIGDIAYQRRSSSSEDKTLNHRVADNAVMVVVKGVY